MLDESVTYIPESNHRIPGLKEFSIQYIHSRKVLKVYYGKILLETYKDEEAITIRKEIEESRKIDRLKVTEISRIASQACGIDVKDIAIKTNKPEYALARWFVYDYLRRFNFSVLKIGRIFDKNHSTVTYGVKEANNEFMNGWRLDSRNRFRGEVDKIHRNAGIKVIKWD